MVDYDASYYEDIRGRLHAVFFAVAERLPATARAFLLEEIDANELGLALEALVDEVEQLQVPIGEPLVADLSRLEGTMGMSVDVVARLSALIIGATE